MSTVDAWNAVLDALEGRIGRALALSRSWDAGADVAAEPLEDFVPPGGLGPVPDELVPRIEALIAAGDTAESEITRLRERLRGRLQALPAPREAVAVAGILDTRA
jgi:hypothetical protein